MTATATAPKKAKAAAASKSSSATATAKRDREFQQVQRAAILLKQTGDPTRLGVIRLLTSGEKYVGEICTTLGMTQPAVSHHLALMRHGSIISTRRQGKNNFYALTERGEKLAAAVNGLIE